MAEMYNPFSDLTEVGRLNYYNEGDPIGGLVPKTEFAFCSVGKYQHEYGLGAKLIAQGWRHVASGLNWYYSHRGDNEVQIWFKELGRGLTAPKMPQKSYANHLDFGLFAYGCGGRVLAWKNLHRQWTGEIPCLTVLRKESKNTSEQAAWLEENRFRVVAEGSRSTIYVNGWEPSAWSKDIELGYWKKRRPRFGPLTKDGFFFGPIPAGVYREKQIEF